MPETNLAQAIEATNDADTAYDTNVKFLLADKQILARMISAQKLTEFYNSDYDSLKKVRSIWICMDSKEDGDSIEEIRLDRATVFGNKINTYRTDLMRGIIINVRIGKNIKDSKNALIFMLESLLSHASVDDKKRLLTEKFGMVMTTELEGRINTMCNWSEGIKEISKVENVLYTMV